MKRCAGLAILFLLAAASASAQRNQQVDPLDHGDLVYIGPTASTACAAVTAFTGSDPCHVGMLTGNNTVTQATSGVEPHAVHTLTLTAFQTTGYRSAMTSYPTSPSSVQRDTLTAYLAAKAARLTYYDANHLNQKGGYDGGCGNGVTACWDGWDYYNEFDCVGLTERAYELAAVPTSDGLTPDASPGNGCTSEGWFFIYPSDQYDSCNTTYSQAFPSVGASITKTVKSGYWQFFTVHTPPGVSSIQATTSSANDVDLYIGTLGFLPTFSHNTCVSAGFTGNEQCQLNNPTPGGWSFGVYGYAPGTSSFNLIITQTGAPGASTRTATNITATSARLNGTVTANGLATTTAFDYGTTAAYGTSIATQNASGTSPTTIFANVSGLACNTLYHYRVRGTNTGGTAYGFNDTFRTNNCTVPFTNDPLVAGVTKARAVHVTELRSAINALRQAAGLAGYPYAETIVPGSPVRASHIVELRAALDNTRAAMSLPKLSYTNAIVPGVRIRAIDVMELRNALR